MLFKLAFQGLRNWSTESHVSCVIKDAMALLADANAVCVDDLDNFMRIFHLFHFSFS